MQATRYAPEINLIGLRTLILDDMPVASPRRYSWSLESGTYTTVKALPFDCEQNMGPPFSDPKAIQEAYR
jgi:hypothetical protein